ncbi:CST complex subunit CTC1 [Procambarus clarkii]|uniref:CST complex subunit CTC1 n=1 Tax=Procambarus clarkii TaxID=6728 RepID=UPI0037443E1D
MEEADIRGRLLALSHTFRISSEDMFFMEMCCGNKIHHIIVRRHSQLAWHQSLEVRSRYRITNLKTFVLFKDKYNIPVLLTTRLSMLTQLEEDERDDDLDVKQDKDLISYKGTITGVVDEEAGIYELDGRHRLIVSYLIDFAGELYTENLAESRTCKSLEKGDSITVYHAHYLRISGIFHLVCCARSLVRKIRKTPVHTHNKRSESSIVDSVHLYNPGIRGIIWLLDLQNSLISALCPKFVDEKLIRRRNWNGACKSLLSNLIKEGARRNLLKRESRSLYQEFMSHYECIVNQDFVAPFTAVTLDSLKTNINPESVAGCEAPTLWHHVVVDGNESKVLVGKLVCGDSGVLQVCQQTSQVPLDLLIVGNKENVFHKVGAVVALFNFIVVIEEFNIFGKISVESVCKKYIMIKSSDVVILKESVNMPQKLIASSEMGSLYNIKIISKSCIVFNNFQSSKGVSGNEICDMFFIARAVVMRLQQRTVLDEMRQTFVRFSGSNALIHSCVQEGHQCLIKIPESENAELLMKKTHSNSWLRPLQSHFGTCECLYIPECVSVVDVTNENCHQTELSVTQILKPEFDNHGLISVIGTVKERAHMTPKFISEIRCFTVDAANKYHVGVPGSKIIRVLLEDQENSNSEIWLYLNSTSNNFIQHYPLGIIPGVSVIASSVKRNVSKANKVYLQGTVFTCLVPVALPAPISNLPHRKRKKFVYLRDAPQHGAFVCFATVGRIIKVSLKSVCCFCNSDMVEGSCTYVGCHAQPTGKIVAAAQVIIDDGTSTALVFIDSVDQVQILLQLSHQQFKLLENNIISGFHQLTYLSIKRRDRELGNSQILLASVSSKVFEKLCSNDQLLRPLTFTCRRFSSQSQGPSRYKDRLHLYCLELSEIHPNVDSEKLVKHAKK